MPQEDQRDRCGGGLGYPQDARDLTENEVALNDAIV
jgi:hypothetical protein